MSASQFKILSLNCRRFERYDKLLNIKNYCELYLPNLICFQEIFIPNHLAVFSEDYEVYVNVEINQKITRRTTTSERNQVFASKSKFHIESVRKQVTYSK